MNASALPLAEGGGVAIHRSPHGANKIQRIQCAAGSNQSKARDMADADEELVLQSQNGNTSAFETLVKNHQQMIHALTFRMTGSDADAEDLAQEAFVRAYKQIGSFNANSKFSTWLYSIAIHTCLNWRRNEARRFQAYANCANEFSTQRTAAEPTPAGAEMAQRAQAALLKLPAKQRAAVVLTIYDGLTHAEAAKVLRCPETTVSWRVFSAKKKLKRWLAAGDRSHERL